MGDLNKATEENPKYIKPYLKRAELYKDLEEFDKAVANYHTVKELQPSFPNIEALLRDARAGAKKAKKKDFYKILGVDKKATHREIKKAWRKAAIVAPRQTLSRYARGKSLRRQNDQGRQ